MINGLLTPRAVGFFNPILPLRADFQHLCDLTNLTPVKRH